MNVSKWLKKLRNKETQAATVHHPEYQIKVEPVFESRGVQYYRFKSDIELPYGRYTAIQTFLLQYDIRMDTETFRGFMNQLKGFLDGSRGNVNLTKAFETILKMEARAELAFEPQQAYNLASVVYFDEHEILYEYNHEYNKRKIASWQEDKIVDFFYTKPLAELLGLNAFSQQDLISYIQEATELLKDLNLDTQSQSSKNTAMT